MAELKIITHTTYTYETSDGREFDDELEAKEWEEQFAALSCVRMLDSELRPTKEVEAAFYVHLKTKEEVEAFNAMQDYLCLSARINKSGYYRYDEKSDSFIDVEQEIVGLQKVIDKLKGGAE